MTPRAVPALAFVSAPGVSRSPRRQQRVTWWAALAFVSVVPLLTAAMPSHKLADGCPLCANGGALSADGLPAYDIGTEASVVPSTPSVAATAIQGTPSTLRSATPNLTSPAAAAPTVAATAVATPPPASANLAASLATPEAPKPFPKIGKDGAGLPRVGFEHLASFIYTPAPESAPPTPGSTARLPAEVRALNGKRVSLTGYMLPTRLEHGLAVEFFIVRTAAMCCYGVTPQPHEWVAVKMKGKGLVPLSDVPLHFTGTLHVGEIYEGDTFVGFYRLEGESVSVK